MASPIYRPLRYSTALSGVFDGLCVANFGTGSLVQVQPGEPSRTKENHPSGSPLFVFYLGKTVFGIIVPRI